MDTNLGLVGSAACDDDVEDGSLDLYIQHATPGIDKESNWLPSPSGNFTLMMRIYIPQENAINGEYQIPPVRLVRNWKENQMSCFMN